MIDQFELTLRNQQSEVSRLQDQLESFARKHGLPARVLHDVQLALEEHLANILSHAYEDALEHLINVCAQLSATELRIRVEDDGRPFNPLDRPEPDLSQPIEERPIGGLGIHMMRKSVDGMEYRREGGRNFLVMTKRL